MAIKPLNNESSETEGVATGGESLLYFKNTAFTGHRLHTSHVRSRITLESVGVD